MNSEFGIRNSEFLNVALGRSDLANVVFGRSQTFVSDGWLGDDSEFRIPNSEFEAQSCA